MNYMTNYIEQLKRQIFDDKGNFTIENIYLGRRCHGRLNSLKYFSHCFDGTSSASAKKVVNIIVDELSEREGQFNDYRPSKHAKRDV